MIPDFNRLLEVLAQEVVALNPRKPFDDSQAYRQNLDLAKKVYSQLTPLSTDFLKVVAGNIKGSSLGIPKFTGETMNFPRRLLKKPSLTDLSPEIMLPAQQVIAHTFLLGLLYHLFFFRFITRPQIETVDLAGLAADWLPKTTVASVVLRNYYKKENQGTARLLFEHYFNQTLEPSLEQDLKIGFWKRGKAHFFLLNLFLAGALLGMEYDLHTQ